MNTLTKNNVETLLKTWMICEATIHLQECLRASKKEIYHQFKACADSCFNMAREIMNPGGFITEDEYIACMVECRTCAVICDNYSHIQEIAYCGALCENCFSELSRVYSLFQLN